MNTEYRTKLFDHWPTYLEDFSGEVGKKIMGYRYPDNLVETFAKLNLDKNVKIMDIPMWMVWTHLKDCWTKEPKGAFSRRPIVA